MAYEVLQHDEIVDFHEQTVCISKEKKVHFIMLKCFLSSHPIVPHNSDIDYYNHVTTNINAHNSTVNLPMLIKLYLLIMIIRCFVNIFARRHNEKEGQYHH